MSYVTGLLRLFLLLVFFLFAVMNYEPASVRFYFDLEWRAPLILILLAFFVLGVVLTLLALLPRLIRQRRETVEGPLRAGPRALTPDVAVVAPSADAVT